MATDPRHLSILNAIAEALNRSPDVESALHRSLALVADLLELLPSLSPIAVRTHPDCP